ncbi:Cys-tRNA(Pro) deacylase [Desulfobulbus rhabdoformis]|uniref:Cys-tRNA(Pro) deacylase n=1 Tax=Desulfobulbus rhabdoformis TaxID=34032 RepID=UPI001965C140|nr:Cys-tRNA(Pro) deacylase [Desulfobulbus rhabdoformis]MBM9613982.1 Cys-tRNA(Pro) deacylase [Desulfobulbus rhabdoformis]
MTPAIKLAQKKKIPYTIHEYIHDPKVTSYGLEAAEKIGVDPACVFKTLVVTLDGQQLAVGVVPVEGMLNMKRMAKAAGAKKAAMAEKTAVERATGYILGGVSPLAQKKRLATVIDASAQKFPTIFVSGGRRGLDIELSPKDLQQLVSAVFAEISDPS